MKLKNVFLMGLSFVLVAAIAIGGTLAYLTDRDSEVNTFTVGDVAIDLTEEFEQGAELVPGVRIQKEATITNTGDNDAWVWMTLAVPAVLDDENTALGSANVLHWNMPGCFWNGYHDDDKYIQSGIKDGYLPADSTGVADEDSWINTNEIIGKETIDEVEYNVYAFLYKGAIVPGETTNVGLSKVFLDENVDINTDGQWYTVENGTATKINWNSNTDGAPRVYVSAYAIQKDQFATVEEAYAAYNIQWGENGTEYAVVSVGYQVSNDAELDAALKAGETEIWLNAGTYHVPDSAKGKTLTINGTQDAVIKLENESGAMYPRPSDGTGVDYSFDGSTVIFNGVTIDSTENDGTYPSFARLTAVYNNCTINGTFTLGTANSNEFNDCTLNVSGDRYNIWTWGTKNVTFNRCTFNCDGKSILVYNQSATVNVTDCVFNDKDGLADEHKAAIETGTDSKTGATYNIIISGTTVNGFNTTSQKSDFGGTSLGTNMWGNKNLIDDDHLNVTIDDKVVY